jgi:hypothetical protein
MKLALQTLLQLRDEGTLAGFALGGAVAASFYAEAVATEDLDVFAFMGPSHSLIGANAVDMARLKSIIEAHALIERWNSYVKRCA